MERGYWQGACWRTVPDDFELIYKRRVDRYPSTIGVGSFAYENVSFMSQIKLPEAMPELGLPAGALVSYPTMAFGMVGDAGTEREAVERVFDHIRKNLVHDTGDNDNIANLFRPYTVTPYSPELGWILYVGEAGSPSSSCPADRGVPGHRAQGRAVSNS